MPLTLDVPALSLLAEEARVEMLASADYRRRAILTGTSEQSAPGADDIRLFFDVPLTNGRMRHWYFDCPIPVYNQIAWTRRRPDDALPTVLLSRALLGDVRERRLDIDGRRLDVIDLGLLAWLLLRLDETGSELAIDRMTEPTLIAFPGGPQPFVRSLGRLRGAAWIECGTDPGRTIIVRKGPRAYGEPANVTAVLDAATA